MKSCREAVAVLVLTLALSTSAFAGEMHTDGAPTPPSPTTNGVIQTGTTDGEMHTGQAADTPEATDAVTEAALTLLQSLLALI
jgi:hypothetical protein